MEKHCYKSLISHKCKFCIYEKSTIYKNVFPLPAALLLNAKLKCFSIMLEPMAVHA